MQLIFWIVLFFYSLISYYSITLIRASKVLNANQKRLNIIATLLIPVLWIFILKTITKVSSKTPLELAEERRKQIGKTDWNTGYDNEKMYPD